MKKKKRKPQDATMRNVRAGRKHWRALARKIEKLEAALAKVAYKVVMLRRPARKR